MSGTGSEPRGKNSLKRVLIVDFLLEPQSNSLFSFFSERELGSHEKLERKVSAYKKAGFEKRTYRFAFFAKSELKGSHLKEFGGIQ